VITTPSPVLVKGQHFDFALQNLPRFTHCVAPLTEGMPQRIGFCAQIYSVFDVRSRFHALNGQA
jgi:hypothetical protein